VIVVTVYDDADSQVEVRTAGAFAYLNKPVKRNTMLETSQRALAHLITQKAGA
jgi:FixJ family two-component response regulator